MCGTLTLVWRNPRRVESVFCGMWDELEVLSPVSSSSSLLSIALSGSALGAGTLWAALFYFMLFPWLTDKYCESTMSVLCFACNVMVVASSASCTQCNAFLVSTNISLVVPHGYGICCIMLRTYHPYGCCACLYMVLVQVIYPRMTFYVMRLWLCQALRNDHPHFLLPSNHQPYGHRKYLSSDGYGKMCMIM